jgi:hypothetical protein
MHTPPDFGFIIGRSEVGNSSFLDDLPMAFSTPLPTRFSYPALDNGVYASGNGHAPYVPVRSGLSTPDIIDELYGSRGFGPNLGRDDDRNLDDVVMNDAPLSYRPRNALHISGNSIISSSGDFTLGPSGYPASSSAAAATIHNNKDNRNEQADEPDSLFQTHDDAMQEPSPIMRQPSPKPKQSIPAHETTMYPITSGPTPARSRPPSLIDELMASKVPAPTSISSPKPSPTVEMEPEAEVASPESVLKDMFDDMGLDAAGEDGSYFYFCVWDMCNLPPWFVGWNTFWYW